MKFTHLIRSACLLLPLLWTANAAALDFTPCLDAASQPGLRGSLCTKETVPLAWDDAVPGELTLFIRQFPASGPSRGSVWLVAGGPGESGASLYPFVDVLRRSFPGFDLIIPDHRGTGFSSRLCPNEEAADSPGGTALAGEEWNSCFGLLDVHPQRARQFTITNAAEDLRHLIQQAHGGKPTYLYGVSYGTQLVLRTLQLGPLPLAGVVLDSMVPLETDARWDLSQRSFVVDDIGRKVLAQCDADPVCAKALGAPAEAVYRRLLANAKADPGVVARVPGKDVRRFLGALLDMPALRSRIPYVIRDLERGGHGVLDAILAELPNVQATLGDYPQTPPSIPLTGIISDSENNLRPGLDAAQVKREEAGLLFTSGIPELLATSTLPIYPRDRWFGGHPAQLPPVLVLQGTLDPKTHYDGALEHVKVLRNGGPVSLVTVTGAPHFILWTAPGCFERQVAAFVAGQVPADAGCMISSD
jgi:pimeloyl-ACP methyl ester carboxylesterase